MDSVVQDLLGAAFGGEIPPTLARLLRDGIGVADLIAFEVSVIVPMGGGPPRFAFANIGNHAEWNARTAIFWPHAQRARFLRLVPPHTRRMVDSDGGPNARYFLDDLQEVAHRLQGPRGFPLMCASLHIPSGELGTISRHSRAPLELYPPPVASAVQAHVARDAKGLWGVQWAGTTPVGAVWVSESRWRGNAVFTRGLVDALGPPPAWDRIATAAERAGLIIYPDAYEWTASGWDVTVGFMA